MWPTVTFVYYVSPPPVPLRPNVSRDLLIIEVSRLHENAQSVGLLWTSDQLVAETST